MNNDPSQWRTLFPFPSKDTHKYMRGHALILGGSLMTGAARLASQAAMRMGAGLCTIIADAESRLVYQSAAAHILYEPLHSSFFGHLQDSRRNVVLLGPGFGQTDPEFLRSAVLETVLSGRYMVLDADALNVFAGYQETLFENLHEHCILTPHEGEFVHLFGDMPGTPAQRAQQAARACGAIIVLKGAETVIAHPDGRVCVNQHATAYLATAGAGDVLAGMILGLLAQSMPVFEAACAAVWIHGEAGRRFGPGLTAPDLVDQIPGILRGWL